MNSRKIFLRRLLWTGMGAVASSARANFGATPVRAGLATSGRFAFLAIRAVEPLGWLREQLQIQSERVQRASGRGVEGRGSRQWLARE
jgi:hypothetical protein